MSASPSALHIPDSLLKPSAYPVPTSRVELIQTHVSWLFLTDTHVFKLKKPVNFGFLDFSTPKLRHFYCNEELRLNRRLCPDIYEQVIELRETAAGAAFIGAGKVLDHAVMMKRLPADRMLDKLVDSGNISLNEINIVAHTICRFHSDAATSPYISNFGSLEQIKFNWQENFDQTLQFQSTTLSPPTWENIRSYVEQFTVSQSDLFAVRIDGGFIRECDGDIHLENICLQNSSAYIFDCIEFNERFRFSDTAADLAFLLMDLDFHHRPDLAAAALASYITESGDANCARLITFYKVYRAFVRGKVESLRLLDSGIPQNDRCAAEKRAIRYFRLAQGYCLRERLQPTLFITYGTMGCGKSTLADQLSFELGLDLCNSDTIRKQMAGLPLETSSHDSFGAGLYSHEMSVKTYSKLERLADNALSAGHSLIIDAGFGSASKRAEFSRLAASHRVDFVILFMHCNPVGQRQRLRERSLRGNSVSDGRIELLDQHTDIFEPPVESEGTIITFSTDGSTDRSLDQIYERLFRS
jgi:aminoglycoside phosphotransferase family enzyme/predicted kinase